MFRKTKIFLLNYSFQKQGMSSRNVIAFMDYIFQFPQTDTAFPLVLALSYICILIFDPCLIVCSLVNYACISAVEAIRFTTSCDGSPI